MTGIADAARAIAADLAAAGVRAVLDERDVNPPCALVGPPTLAYRFGKCWADATWRVLVIVPDSGRDVSLGNLAGLLAKAAPAVNAAGAIPASFAGVDGAPPYPAYELTFTTRVDL